MSLTYRNLVGRPYELGMQMMANGLLRHLANAHAINQATLQQILALNGPSQWGHRYGLDQPHAREAFRELPLTTYKDYAPFVERVAAGEAGVLTTEPVTYFAVTSGTTGAQKLIPVTQRQGRMIMQLMMAPIGLGLIAGHVGPIRGRSLFITTEQISGTTAGGIPRGAATSNGLRRMGPIFDYLWTSPLAVVQIQEQSISRYLHILFALGEERLWMMTSIFPATLLFALRDLHSYADELLRDLADGTITRRLDLPAALRTELEQRLRPNPRRAHHLAALHSQGRFTVHDIWPEVRMIATAGSGTFRFYIDQLRPYLGDIPMFSPVYAASEAVIGIGLSPHHPGYVLAVGAVYPEFLPLASADQPGVQPLAMEEVSPGEAYEIVITTYAGLLRYRLGDIVRVIGHYGQSPIIEFLERKGQVISIVGEKTSEAQIAHAFEATCRQIGASVVDYIVTPDPSFTPARYLLLIEALPTAYASGDAAIPFAAAQLLETFEQQLQRSAPSYANNRRMGKLGPTELRILHPGAFERFRALRVAAGASAAQVKVPHVLPDPSLVGRHFFDEMLHELVPA